MYSFKPFYIYQNRPRHHHDIGVEKLLPRGFTAKIEPSKEPHKVLVSIAFCAYKDEFVKKTGRALVDVLPGQLVNARDIPRVLAEAATKCDWFKTYESSYYYVLKFML